MLHIEITEDECREMAQVLAERMGELSEEIHHASVSTFRDQLRARKVRLQALLEKLEHAPS